ncbi:hypothetical protein [Pedobacter gandavensis]|uniref:TlpA family protein disulfide reductase n=1 Tax=Pedobacter gandavensis TaxID=2679963 RepID=UPI00292EF0B1|nr:hypothetical protein [Pedobacter gandavensis]
MKKTATSVAGALLCLFFEDSKDECKKKGRLPKLAEHSQQMRRRLKCRVLLTGLVLATGIFTSPNAVAQQAVEKHTAVLLGERLPSILWEKPFVVYQNGKYHTESLSKYKGKIIILEFWSSSCSGCLKGFPKINALQKQYPDRLKVFTVNTGGLRETIEKIEHAYSLLDKDTRSLPSIVNDRLLRTLFPFRVLSSCAWIKPDGSFYAFTPSEMVNEHNIDQVIAAEMILEERREKVRAKRNKASDEK